MPSFYTVPVAARMLGLSYETTLNRVKRNQIPAMQLEGSRMYIIPAYWLADRLAECVAAYGPPTTAAGTELLLRAGVSEAAVMQSIEAHLMEQGEQGTATEPVGDPPSAPVADTLSTEPRSDLSPGLKNGS
jgi:hypothetical protein